jgi:pyochelin synthetase
MPETNGEKLPFEMVMRMYKTYCQSFKASQYTPEPYFGTMRYLVAEDDSASIPGQEEAAVDFWEKVCLGEFTTGTIQGNHYTCIEPPYVKDVADWVGMPLFEIKKKGITL